MVESGILNKAKNNLLQKMNLLSMAISIQKNFCVYSIIIIYGWEGRHYWLQAKHDMWHPLISGSLLLLVQLKRKDHEG